MHRVRIFFNETASSSRALDWRNAIRYGLFRSQLEFVSAQTLPEFQQELKRAAQDAVDVVISVGGDGTFNTLLQELAGSETAFLIIPAGTANDLARELGISRRLRKAIEHVRRNEINRIDLIRVNGTLMATNGGIGLVSDVALRVNQLRSQVPGFKRLMRSLHHHTYSLALGSHLALHRYHQYPLTVTSEEFKGEVVTPLLLVNNQPNIAGNFAVAPHTRNNDGSFNVTIFKHQKWADFIGAVLRIKRGLGNGADPDIISFETKHLTLETKDKAAPISFFGDGEHLASSNRLDFTISPSSLKVFRPYCPSGGNGEAHS